MATTDDAIISPGYAVCAFERIIVLVWKDTPSIEGVRALKKVFERARAPTVSTRFALLTLIETKAGKGMPAAVRDELARVIKGYEPVIKTAAIVYEDAGFRATIVRSVITAINMMNRPAYSFSVFANRLPAIEQILSQMGSETSATTSAVAALLNELTKQVQQASIRPVV